MADEGVDSRMYSQQEVRDLGHQDGVRRYPHHGLQDLYQGGVGVSWQGGEVLTVTLL